MCIGLSFCHAVADERTFNNFMKSWALICKSLFEGQSNVHLQSSLPSYGRNVIIDQKSHLQTTLLTQWWDHMILAKGQERDLSNMVRATFVLSVTHLEGIKNWIIAQCNSTNEPHPLLLSKYVLACAFVWVCLVKTQGITKSADSCEVQEPIVYLGFNAGGIHRLDFRVPTTYFGNCVAFGRLGVLRSELVGEDGVVVAAKAIGKTIRELDEDVLRGAEKWISEWEELLVSNVHVMVVGSPKVNLYDMDFGWGKPNKIEKISSDSVTSICLCESREFEGGIEVGVCLDKSSMDCFTSLFDRMLKVMA